MSELRNLTPFSAVCIPSLSTHDELLTLVVIAGHFVLPTPGIYATTPLQIAEQQDEVQLADAYRGNAATSSLLYEGQSSYTRPCTDLYLEGHAWAPAGRPVTRSNIRLQVGVWKKEAVVSGERVWKRGIGGTTPSNPEPFTSIPLIYERCFGGWPESPARHSIEAAERNPVGRGLFNQESEARDGLLPNIEDPSALLHSPANRPLPCGFGPIARQWRPRRAFSGSYSPDWVKERAPLWPPDVNEWFFAAAPSGLQASPYLEGGEPVSIDGMSPDGRFAFPLPRFSLQARFEQRHRQSRKRMILDAVLFDTAARRLTLYWRAFIVANPLSVGTVTVRELEPWELAG